MKRTKNNSLSDIKMTVDQEIAFMVLSPILEKLEALDESIEYFKELSMDKRGWKKDLPVDDEFLCRVEQIVADEIFMRFAPCLYEYLNPQQFETE
jgi:hypothetical protein